MVAGRSQDEMNRTGFVQLGVTRRHWGALGYMALGSVERPGPGLEAWDSRGAGPTKTWRLAIFVHSGHHNNAPQPGCLRNSRNLFLTIFGGSKSEIRVPGKSGGMSGGDRLPGSSSTIFSLCPCMVEGRGISLRALRTSTRPLPHDLITFQRSQLPILFIAFQYMNWQWGPVTNIWTIAMTQEGQVRDTGCGCARFLQGLK